MNRAAFLRAFALAALPPIGVAEASTVMPAAVTARLGGQLSVLDFPSFQAAHDALPPVGGTIHVPAGRYSSTTVPAFNGMVIKKPIALIGVANGYGCALSLLMHDGDKDKDAIFVNLTSGCLLQNLFILRPDSHVEPGAGRGVRWYVKGTKSRMAGLTIDNVTVWRSPNWSFEFLCDGFNFNYVSKLVMTDCTAFDASSGGSLHLGGAGSDNNFFSRCEFNGPGFGWFFNVDYCQVKLGASTVDAPSFAGVAVGDVVTGMGIVVGTTVTAVTPKRITLSEAAIQDYSPTQLSFWRAKQPAGVNAMPRGHVHLVRTLISRFHHCSFQGPGTQPALTTDLVSHDLELRDCYREKATAGDSVHTFLISGVNNFLIDGLFMQYHDDQSLLLKTGSGGMNMGRITNAQLVTTDTAGADVVHLSNPGDELSIDHSMEQNFATGARRGLAVAGPGAVILGALRPGTQGALALPNGSDDVFLVAGDAAVKSITALRPKQKVTLVFKGNASLTRGSNLLLSSDFSGGPNRTITLVCDGTNWLELGRSTNG
jgi:hypothetical protein